MATNQQYRVFSFVETKEIITLPISWIKSDGTAMTVKLDTKKVLQYIRSGKMPYKKWTNYEVVPLNDQVFESYEVALKAEKLLSEQTDIDDTDMESLLNTSNGQLSKKRKRKPNVPFSPTNSLDLSNTSNASDSDGDGDHCDDPPTLQHCSGLEIPREIHLPQKENEGREGNEPSNEAEIIINAGQEVVQPQTLPVCTLASAEDIQELKTMIELQGDRIEAKIEELQNALLRKRQDAGAYNVPLNVARIAQFEEMALPLQELDDILVLEKKLTDEAVLENFKKFLLQIGGKNLKIVIKLIIQKIYHLRLQQKINYSGREQKFKLKDLIQTKAMLDVMQIGTGATAAESVDELMYHLQHTSDRVRTANKAEM